MPVLKGALSKVADQAMDLTVVPGFSAIGYRARRRMGGWEDPPVKGKSVMVTGTTSGLGEAASLDLARLGADVHMVCRNRQKGETVQKTIKDSTGADTHLHICDLSHLDSVRAFAAECITSGLEIDSLINNAGVMPPERTKTEAGFELTFATNVLGTYLLTELLLPLIPGKGEGRVVTMSSGGMYSSGFDFDDPQLENTDYKPTAFYAQTKRAEVMLTQGWAEREGDLGPMFLAMHPGWAVTDGMSAALPGFNKVLGPILRDAHECADTAVWLSGAARRERNAGGSMGRPGAWGRQIAVRLRRVATSELVVPRAMPAASRCLCGSVDMPGSVICNRAIGAVPCLFSVLVFEREQRFVDFLL